MPQDYPDHHDADLVLRLYDLRREPVMRESRLAINSKFWPKSAEECLEVLQPGHDLNAPFRQTSGYWEMAYSMARYGIVHPDFLLESTDEGLFLFARVHPYLEALRQVRGPRMFRNAEWIATQTDVGKEIFARLQQRVASVLASR